MKRNTFYAFAAMFLVLLGGLGLFVGYKGYKKYKAKQNQEFRCQVPMGKALDGFDKDIFKKSMLTEDVLDEVIKSNDLLVAWGMADPEAAKSRIRQKFLVTVSPVSDVHVSYQDKEKELAKKVMEAIVTRYHQKMKRLSPPSAMPQGSR